jgi:hypothetical protein
MNSRSPIWALHSAVDRLPSRPRAIFDLQALN